ncbi:MAG: hypothetical protein DRP11_04995 [Candidatus Aenigmatarchaeota archaeon]|nr:MAG: hypothetical protein DRP11_04995 [Candidatus Aenigmarchaeota archaeon]
MLKRWPGTALLEAEKKFRKIRDDTEIPKLYDSLQVKSGTKSKRKNRRAKWKRTALKFQQKWGISRLTLARH